MKKNLDKILEADKLSYEKVKDYIDFDDKLALVKIINKLHNFDEISRKRICLEIITNTKDIKIIDNACQEIITFIDFDYEYYKEIARIIANKNISGETWIDSLIKHLLKDIRTLQDVFEDFSRDIPLNSKYDSYAFTIFLEKYNEQSLDNITIKKENIILICKRIMYVFSIHTKRILDFYMYYDKKFNFNMEELSHFIYSYIFNYTPICEDFLSRHTDYNSLMIDIIKSEVKRIREEEKIKYGMTIFNVPEARLLKYVNRRLKQSTQISNMAKEKSVFFSLCRSNTILYGRKYGMTVKCKNKREVSINEMYEHKIEYSLPYEYSIDAVEYNYKINHIEDVKRGS